MFAASGISRMLSGCYAGRCLAVLPACRCRCRRFQFQVDVNVFVANPGSALQFDKSNIVFEFARKPVTLIPECRNINVILACFAFSKNSCRGFISCHLNHFFLKNRPLIAGSILPKKLNHSHTVLMPEILKSYTFLANHPLLKLIHINESILTRLKCLGFAYV